MNLELKTEFFVCIQFEIFIGETRELFDSFVSEIGFRKVFLKKY